MTIDGRFTIDVLVHDADTATSSLKVLAIDGSDAVATGKVALITSTVGTAAATIARTAPGYTAADGSVVSFATVERVALSATPHVELTTAGGRAYFASGGRVGVYEMTGSERTTAAYSIRTTAGTASYSLLLYGT
ncbi:MAG: hypothetical protein EBQ89_03920 [Alphaproteobacteria bacterium]|nr:hypothetical protein [Alphaproteobacteria bacterium]